VTKGLVELAIRAIGGGEPELQGWHALLAEPDQSIS
jgi:hypothetical protein